MSQIFSYPGNQEDYPNNQQGLLDYDYAPESGFLFYCYKITDSTKFSISKSSTLLSIDSADIKPSNVELIKRQVIYLPKAEREQLRSEMTVWADFFEAHDYFMAEDNYPIDTPDEEKVGKKRNLEEAIRRLHLLADGPDNFAPAKYFLALAYENKWDGLIDIRKSTEYYQKAADDGIAEAQYTLGNYYKFGIEVEEDHKLSRTYYKKAANQGMVKAQFSTAQAYQYGSKRKPEKAFSYYTLAAQNRHPVAQYELGNCYFTGYGTKVDYEKAKEYFTLALQNGHKPAEEALNRFNSVYKHGPFVLLENASFSPEPSNESEHSLSAEDKSLHNLTKTEMSQIIFTMKGQIEFLMTEMREMKKRLVALEQPKVKREHGGKESHSKRLKLYLDE